MMNSDKIANMVALNEVAIQAGINTALA